MELLKGTYDQLRSPRERRARPPVAPPRCRLTHERVYLCSPGADISFNRQHRLDVAIVQNHPIALSVLLVQLLTSRCCC